MANKDRIIFIYFTFNTASNTETMIKKLILICTCMVMLPTHAMTKDQQDNQDRWQQCLVSPVSGQEVSDLIVKISQFGIDRDFRCGELVIIKSETYDDNDEVTFKYRYAYIGGLGDSKSAKTYAIVRKNKIQKKPVAKIIDSSGYVTKVVPIWANIKPEFIAASSQVPPLVVLIKSSIAKLLLEKRMKLEDIKKGLPFELSESVEKLYLIEKCRQEYAATLNGE